MGEIYRSRINDAVTYSIRDSARYCKVNPPWSNPKKRKKKRASFRFPVPFVKRNGGLEDYWGHHWGPHA